MSAQRPATPVQGSGRVSGLPAPDSNGNVGDDAPYAGVLVASGPACEAPLVDAPLFGGPAEHYDSSDAMEQSWVGRQQPPIGLGSGSYVLGDAQDQGAPVDNPDHGLPALRDGEYLFSNRLRNLGDQAIVDPLVQSGGSYLGVIQPPWNGDDRPAGR